MKETGGRVSALDFTRGCAVLGILLMNAVAIGIGMPAYYNVSMGLDAMPLDTAIGVWGEIFVDQKFMGIFSLLFGASVLLFFERAAGKGLKAMRLSLWRNGLLFAMGAAHAALWDGDVLLLYALCAPLLLVSRNLPASVLGGAGGLLYASSALLLWWAQTHVPGEALAGYWTATEGLREASLSDDAGGVIVLDAFLRALGAMLVGMALYKRGWLTASELNPSRRRVAVAGVALGVLGGSASVWWAWSAGYADSVAFAHNIPNTLGALPMAIGYALLFAAWDARAPEGWTSRVRALGRMALTNYIGQTVLCLLVLASLPAERVTRTTVLAFVFVVWAVQLQGSRAWLRRFRFGPLEWLWRSATYRHLEPLRRRTFSA